MGKHSLSKSTFIKGLQCLKFLYLYKNHYTLRDRLSAQKLATFKRGTNIGILAQDRFPGGINLAPKSHFQYDAAVQSTAQHIKDGHKVLYEPSFNTNDVLIFLDILVQEGNGWHAYEVKSSLNISETYLNDAALQYYVMKGSGLQLEDISLITVNKDYVRKDKIDVNELFISQSVLTEVLDRQENIAHQIELQKKTLLGSNIPIIPIGKHCYNPYDCEFIGHCWKEILSKPSIFDLHCLPLEERFAFVENGIDNPEALLNDANTSQRLKTKMNCLLNKSAYIDKAALKKFLGRTDDSICFLNLLSFRPALPLFEGNKPYEIFPYMASISYDEDNTNKFIFTLSEIDTDSRHSITDFLEDIALKFSKIVVYDKTALETILLAEQKRNPQQKYFGNQILEKVSGLKEVFDMGFYDSYKLKEVVDMHEVLIQLGLKSPYPKKDSINNIYQANDYFQTYLKNKNQESTDVIVEKLTQFSRDNNYYLKRLYDFFIKSAVK